MDKKINSVSKSVHCHIHAIPLIRPSICEDMAQMVACTRVGSCLDYANSVLYDTTQKTSPNFKQHKTSLQVLSLVPFSPVHIISSNASTGSH